MGSPFLSLFVCAIFLGNLNVANAEIKQRRMELIQKYVIEAAARESLDPALVRAVIRVESNYNHKALSRAGARGLMQLMPPTAEQLGFRKALDSRNPRANILAGTRYLREMINLFDGDKKLAIAAYNAGPGAVKRYRGIPPYRETKEYVVKVFRELEKEKQKAALVSR